MATSAELLERLKALRDSGSSTSVAETNVRNIVASLAGGQAIAGPLAEALNAAAAREFEKGLSRAFPEARQTFAQMTDVAQSQMRGELPADVKGMVEQYAAEQNVQGGLRGGIAGSRTARDLGRTSLDLVAQGQRSASELFNIARGSLTAPTVDVGQMSTSISSALAGATTMSPAQAEQLKLDKERLAQSKQLAESGDRLAAAQFAESTRRFDMQFEWDKTLSELNLQMDKWRTEQQRSLAEEEYAFKAEQAKLSRDTLARTVKDEEQRRAEDLFARTLSVYQRNSDTDATAIE